MIDSILNQTFNDFELIVIDDGSTDNTLDIIKKYNDHRIRILLNDHNFVRALNMGALASKGKYIVRMDADDIMISHRLETQYDYMEKNLGIDVCSSSYELIGTQSGIVQQKLTSKQVVLSLILQNPLCHPSIIMKRSLVDEKSFDCLYKQEYLYAEDYKLWVDLAIKGCKFSVIPDVLIKYRISNKQVSVIHHEKMKQQFLIIQQEYISYIQKVIEKENSLLRKLLSESEHLFQNKAIGYRCYQNLLFSLYSEILYES